MITVPKVAVFYSAECMWTENIPRRGTMAEFGRLVGLGNNSNAMLCAPGGGW